MIIILGQNIVPCNGSIQIQAMKYHKCGQQLPWQAISSLSSVVLEPLLDGVGISLQPLGVESDGLTVLFDHPLS